MSDESMRARVGDLQRRLADVEALVTEMCATTTMAVELTEERERAQVQAQAETQTEAKAPQVNSAPGISINPEPGVARVVDGRPEYEPPESEIHTETPKGKRRRKRG